MTFHTANVFDGVCQLDRSDTVDEVPQNKKKRKLPLGYFLTNFTNKILLVVSLVVPRKPLDRSVVDVLLTF